MAVSENLKNHRYGIQADISVAELVPINSSILLGRVEPVKFLRSGKDPLCDAIVLIVLAVGVI